MNFEVIGISGKAGTGKDYIAEHILGDQGYKRWSLAWHFKNWIVGKGLATYEEVFITKPPHIRALLQEEGTERGRMLFGENIWTKTSRSWMQCLADHMGIKKFVIPDIRFPNEVEFVHSCGGRVFRIVAPNRDAQSGLTEEARQHPSETSLDGAENLFDGFIHNDFGQEYMAHAEVETLLRPVINISNNLPFGDAPDFEAMMNQFSQALKEKYG